MLGWLYRLGDLARDRARRARWEPDQARGRRGEDLAHRFLRRRGYAVVARNWRTETGSGELDVVAWEGKTLVFVEVKSRASEEYGTPDRAVDAEKRGNLIRAAREYARHAGVDWHEVRFDLVNVVFSYPVHIEVVKDAFSPRAAAAGR
jgi:putative endonuclease